MKRQIIKIDEELCTGCGVCVPNCHEGALQIIDGKARLISDLMCDGLGACIGHCPEGAITFEEREAEPYNEVLVMKEMVPKGFNTVLAHLQHLKDHNEMGFMKEGMHYLMENKDSLDFDLEELKKALFGEKVKTTPKPAESVSGCGGGCPGSQTMSFNPQGFQVAKEETGSLQSQLRQWPVQMHLINPGASYFQSADLLMAADCVAFSLGNFHQKYLKDKALAIACPKLDSDKQVYLEKLVRLIDEALVNTITVMIMEVPCCGGLLQLVQLATQQAKRKVPVKAVVVGIQGTILSEQWI